MCELVEDWRDVIGYEGIYEVSNLGEVRTKLGRTTHSKRSGIRVWKQKTMRQTISPKGYRYVNLYKNGKCLTYLVHRLVAIAFLPIVEDKRCVNHKDGNHNNNTVSNLEWCNDSENNNHAFDNNLIKTGVKIILHNESEDIFLRFRSETKACEFLNQRRRFITKQVNKGNFIIGDFRVYISKN